MKVVKKKLADLKHPATNVRMHTDKQIAEFKRSVEMFGQIRPIVVDENNIMLAGNGLYDTLVALGRTEADCYVVTGLSDNEKKKLMLADNRIFDLGVDDMRAFDAIIAELGGDLDVPGFDEDLLRTMVADSDDVDEIISDYGIVPEERRSEIASTQVTYTPRPAPAEHAAANSEVQEGTPTANYVVCPHCGERVWL